jgi:hypothetical protein
MGSGRFGDRRNNWLHKRLWFNNKRSEHLCLIPAGGDLARMLISGESQGEHTEE